MTAAANVFTSYPPTTALGETYHTLSMDIRPLMLNNRLSVSRNLGTMDRRAARTRAYLHEALLHLLSERNYEAVTVEEICRRAGVGRSTFYAHFHDKGELKRSQLAALQRRLSFAARSPRSELQFAFSLPMLQHAKENLSLYRSLVSKGSTEAMFPAMRQMLVEQVRAELATRKLEGPLSRVPRVYLAKAVAGTFFALMLAWLDDGAVESEQEVDAAFHALLGLGQQAVQIDRPLA
jgi:AcrR family transcriptional regulator